MYLFGGNIIAKADVYVFYTESNEIEQLMNLDQPRCEMTLYLDAKDSQLYIIGGFGNKECIKECLIFDIPN